MLSKNEAIETVSKLMISTDDEMKKNLYATYLEKINSVTDEELAEVAEKTLGKNSGVLEFEVWLQEKAERHIRSNDFIKLNDFVSYNIAVDRQDTLALHVVPKHVTQEEIRKSGTYLVDALEQIIEKINNGEIKDIETIFAVSDILKLRVLQNNFSRLGFKVERGEEAFREHFKNPYQASLQVKYLLSKEWQKIKDEFMTTQLSIQGKVDPQDPGDGGER